MYLAFGIGTTPVANTDTKLVNEQFRKLFTKKERSATGQLKTYCYIDTIEANFTIEEVGIFAGDGATASKDTGVCISRMLWHHVKNNLETLYIIRTDTFGRGV